MLTTIAMAAALAASMPAQTGMSVSAKSICALEIVEHAKIAEVIDGDTVRLADHRQVRLVGTQAPKLSLGRKNFVDWPLASEAKAVLEKLVEGKVVGLGYGGLKIDRNGRTLAHLYLDATWVQGAMISAGMARVYTWPDNRACIDALLAHEREARAASRGIWALRHYRIRNPGELANEVDTFQLVEGQVVAAAERRGRVFLNFGGDYKTDFTVTIAPEDLKLFAFDPQTLSGKRIRARGWISLLNGPEIQATHPEQIEILP
jgi:micrococcal nuclease